MARPACPAPMTTVVTVRMAVVLSLVRQRPAAAQSTTTVTFVGLVTMS